MRNRITIDDNRQPFGQDPNEGRELIELSYLEYSDQLRNYIKYKTGCNDAAEDIMHDIFLKLLESHVILRKESIKWLLFSIARNLVVDFFRHSACRHKAVDYMSRNCSRTVDDVEGRIFSDELEVAERKAVDKLSPKRAQIYIMYRYGERSFDEIATTLSLSKRTIENHMYQARIQIREGIACCRR